IAPVSRRRAVLEEAAAAKRQADLTDLGHGSVEPGGDRRAGRAVLAVPVRPLTRIGEGHAEGRRGFRGGQRHRGTFMRSAITGFTDAHGPASALVGPARPEGMTF